MNDVPEDILARMKSESALEQARRKEGQSNTVVHLKPAPRSMTIEEVRALEARRAPKQISQPTSLWPKQEWARSQCK